MSVLRNILIFIWCCHYMLAYSQSDSSISSRPLIGLVAGIHYGSIFAHTESVQNTAGSHPLGVELQFMKQQVDKNTYNVCRCFPKQSILTSVYSFDNEVLGWSAIAAYLLEPSYRISDRILFSIRGSIGLSYASNPFDADKNPTNQSYSTTVNGYLLYGVGIQWQFDQRFALED